MTNTAPFLTIQNDTGLSLPRLVLRLLGKAVAPSMRAFTWVCTSAPSGAAHRAAEGLLHLYCHNDQSGAELTIGARRLCFGVDRKTTGA